MRLSVNFKNRFVVTTYLVLGDDGLNSAHIWPELIESVLEWIRWVDCASITCCGNEFQLLQTRTLKNVFRNGLKWHILER